MFLIIICQLFLYIYYPATEMFTCVNNLGFPYNRPKYQAKEDGFLSVGLVIEILGREGELISQMTSARPLYRMKSIIFFITLQGKLFVSSQGGICLRMLNLRFP